MNDPDMGDYRPREGSAAESYGCQTFSEDRKVATEPTEATPPPEGLLLSGAEIQVGGLITENTTWDADLVQVTASVEVVSAAALTIAPGTRVEFLGDYKLLVKGRLWADGEPDDRIIFTAAAELQDSGWDGIEFLNIPAANELSRLEHCDLSYAVAKPGDEGNLPLEGTTRTGAGGAISIVGVNNLEIASCVFYQNSAEYGGAVYCGYGSSPALAGNLFYDNTATWNGSVLFNVYAYPKLINNTLADNKCLQESSFHLGSAVDNFNGKIVLSGNIIRNNFTNHYSGMQLFANKDYYTMSNNVEAYAGNDSNIDEDAGFVDFGTFPYQLLESSHCIDTGGYHALHKALADYDIAGNERVYGASIDMGAFEYCGSLSSALQQAPSPLELTLSCAPNPFNPRTKIVFDIPVASQVALKIFDIQGRLLYTVLDGSMEAGRHEILWHGCDMKGRTLASGTYLYQLSTGSFQVNRTMTLIR